MFLSKMTYIQGTHFMSDFSFPINRTFDFGIASVMHNHIMQQKMSIDNKEYLHNLHKNT